MATLIQLLSAVAWLVHVVCFIMVLIQMFKRGQANVGIACLVLSLCCGLGSLVAFVYGWTKAAEWNIKNLMLAWTGAFLVSVLLSGVGYATGSIVVPAG